MSVFDFRNPPFCRKTLDITYIPESDKEEHGAYTIVYTGYADEVLEQINGELALYSSPHKICVGGLRKETVMIGGYVHKLSEATLAPFFQITKTPKFKLGDRVRSLWGREAEVVGYRESGGLLLVECRCGNMVTTVSIDERSLSKI